jgi:hypothetical protein
MTISTPSARNYLSLMVLEGVVQKTEHHMMNTRNPERHNSGKNLKRYSFQPFLDQSYQKNYFREYAVSESMVDIYAQ